MGKLRQWAARLKSDVGLLQRALRSDRVPWYAKAVGFAVVAYALSPIDLIPDFIPVIGYLDDLILLPAGLWLTLRMVPKEVIAELRAEAPAREQQPWLSRTAAVMVVVAWVAIPALVVWRLLG